MTAASTLAARLRMLADEVESAERYGIPIPFCFTVGGHQYSGASFPATEEEFDAWVDYTEATVEHYEHEGRRWSRANVDCNGLPLSFAVQHADPAVLADAAAGVRAVGAGVSGA